MDDETQTRDIVVVGGSAGGIEALKSLVNGLPADLPAALFVVIHVARESPRLLADILDRAGALPCQYARDQEAIQQGRIYLAPPDYHLLLEQDRMRVVRGPRENRFRPAIDPLFRSAALAYGPRTIGILLSGMQNDGTDGLLRVKQAGGVAVVQDPADCLYPSMPQSALEVVEVDHVVPQADLSSLLVQLAGQPVPADLYAVSPEMQIEANMAFNSSEERERLQTVATPSFFTCPECGGVLNQLDDKIPLRYRCQVGHAFTAEALGTDQIEAVERSLWIALRTLEERIELQQQMIRRATQQGRQLTATQWQNEMQDMEQDAGLLRQLLYKGKA